MRGSQDIDRILARWRMPQLPQELKAIVAHDEPNLKNLQSRFRAELSGRDIDQRTGLELVTLDWLYDLVRENIKRGRAFELEDALGGNADCLGYAKIFKALGPRFGLDLGVVEVVIDNRGRYVPHHAAICSLSNGERRFLDPWYGSEDISHRRIGARVKEEGGWRIRDVDQSEIQGIEEIRGLPDECIDAITYYIRGNRHLEMGIRQDGEELNKAIDCYSKAISLYPGNARFYFNRAIAYERRGEGGKAEIDYELAFRDESSMIRLMASVEEMERLLQLDEKGIALTDQQVYLLRKGYLTGREVSLEEVAREFSLSEEEALKIISEVEMRLGYQKY